MSLRSKFASGSGWMAIGATADYAVQFVVFTMLARLVSVTELGIVAFGLVLTDIGRIFVNGGRAESIVRHGVWDDGFAGAAFTRTMAFAILLAAILAGPVSWAVDRYYAAGSGWPTAALSLIFVIEALRSIHGAKLRREFQYKQLAQRMIVGTVLSGTIAVVLAMNGWGVWALVIQRLVQQVVTTLLTLRAAKWRPVLRWHDRTLTELSQFSRRVTGTRALDVANQRMPDFLIGLALGPVPVALYRVGARSLEVIMRVTVQPFQDASLSALSRVGSPEAIGGALLRVLRAAALLIFPIYVGAAVLGTEMTVLLFGEKYAESGEVMSALAFGGLASTLLLVVGSAYLASGHAQASLRANIALVVASAILILIGGHFAGTLGAAIAVSAAQWLIVPLHLYMLRRYLGITPLRLLGGLSRPFLAALAMALPLIVLQHTLLADQSLLVRFAALVPAGGVAYLLALLAFGRGYLRDLIAEVRPMLPAKVARRLPGGKHTD